jgi:3-isopropylmalate/(R)-2-methylmalate dehydratase small subunit
VALPAIDLDEPFELDDHTHHRLLHGLDDIGLTEQHVDEVAAFEAARPAYRPSAPA